MPFKYSFYSQNYYAKKLKTILKINIMIKKIFEKAKSENRALFAAFFSCGDPNIEFSERAIEVAAKNGADIIELGVPFSDPMADGPVIQSASVRALDAGTNILQIIEMAKRLRSKGVDAPMILFGYFNTFLKCGLEKIAELCADAKINGWLIADLPLEEMDEVMPILKKHALDFIPLAAPTTPLERIAEISNKCSGFLYYVTVAGVTGVRNSLPEGLADRLENVRKASSLPVGAGFGISNSENAHAAAMHADCVIVGSKLVQLLHETRVEKGDEAAIDAAAKFTESIANAMRR